MSYGYASNIARHANLDKGSMHGMKSRVSYVFMECLLPIVFQSLPEFVWNALVELCQFFKDLCCNTLRMNYVIIMKENISIILCKLERIFLSTFFDSMEHFVIHLPMKAILGDHIQY